MEKHVVWIFGKQRKKLILIILIKRKKNSWLYEKKYGRKLSLKIKNQTEWSINLIQKRKDSSLFLLTYYIPYSSSTIIWWINYGMKRFNLLFLLLWNGSGGGGLGIYRLMRICIWDLRNNYTLKRIWIINV